jgi:hypothetical protein
MNKRIVALVASTLMALALAVVGIGVAKRPPGASRRPQVMQSHASETAQPQGVPQVDQTKEVQDTRPLKEKAKEVGNFVGTEAPKKTAAYADLADLAKQSTAVIIGTAEENHPTLSPDGKSITINYKVRVEYVYKGKLAPGNNILVSLPGGKVTFADGSSAEIQTGWFKKMQNGKTYALFLSPGSERGLFVTTGEAQGLFEIPTTEDDQTVKAHSGIPRDPIGKYEGTDVKTFLRELRQATKKPLKS